MSAYGVFAVFAGRFGHRRFGGLFGIGGGLIMVPVLIFSFKAQGVSAELITHMALATSLATIVFTSIKIHSCAPCQTSR